MGQFGLCRGGSGRGIYQLGADHWDDLGETRLERLVALDTTPYHDFNPVVDLRGLFDDPLLRAHVK